MPLGKREMDVHEKNCKDKDEDKDKNEGQDKDKDKVKKDTDKGAVRTRSIREDFN